MLNIKDRVVGLEKHRAKTLQPHEKNWRIHPEAQKGVMTEMLSRIGNAGAIIGRKLPSGVIQILDGHMRSELMPEELVSVLIVDLNDEEADLFLATHDPIGAMARKDHDMLGELLEQANMKEGEYAKWVKETIDKAPKEQMPDLSALSRDEPVIYDPAKLEDSPITKDPTPGHLKGETTQVIHTCPRCTYSWQEEKGF